MNGGRRVMAKLVTGLVAVRSSRRYEVESSARRARNCLSDFAGLAYSLDNLTRPVTYSNSRLWSAQSLLTIDPLSGPIPYRRAK